MAQVKSEPQTAIEAEVKAAKANAAKMKPSYKHVPHSQKPPHLVAKRNARERRRVQAVNQAFYRLRKCVPIENRNKRVSKVKTLQRAIDYIRKLERILEEEDSGGGDQQVLGAAANCLQQQQQQQASNGQQKRGRKATTNCDQVQQPPISANHLQQQQQPQIIVKQKRGRKPSAQSARSKALAVSAAAVSEPQQPSTNSGELTCRQQPQQPPLIYSGEAVLSRVAKPATMETQHKFAEPYCSSSMATCTYPPEIGSEILRESSAYNSNLNYYADQEHQQNQQPTHWQQPQHYAAHLSYLAPAEAAAANSQLYQQHQAATSSSYHASFHYPQVAPYTAGDAAASQVAGWSQVTRSSRKSGESSAANLSGDSGATLHSSPGSQMSSSLDQQPVATSAACSVSFAPLQSPSASSTSSSLTNNESVVGGSSSSGSDNSSAVVCRSRGSTANSTAGGSVPGHRQQVNSGNYPAYARATHLSFAVGSNNDNAAYQQQQQQQQSDGSSSSKSSADAATGGREANLSVARHQVSHSHHHHLPTAAAHLTANNLHEQSQSQYNNQHQQHHHHHRPQQQQQQQQSFLSNQHSHQLNQPTLSSGPNPTTTNTTNSLMNQNAIQEYSSLPL